MAWLVATYSTKRWGNFISKQRNNTDSVWCYHTLVFCTLLNTVFPSHSFVPSPAPSPSPTLPLFRPRTHSVKRKLENRKDILTELRRGKSGGVPPSTIVYNFMVYMLGAPVENRNVYTHTFRHSSHAYTCAHSHAHSLAHTHTHTHTCSHTHTYARRSHTHLQTKDCWFSAPWLSSSRRRPLLSSQVINLIIQPSNWPAFT